MIDLLRAARRCIYIETQYFTSKVLPQTLEDLLQREDGPDIVMILHPSSDGWLEQHTMDVLRGRMLKHLHTIDRHHRLALYYPRVPDAKERCVSVHSKVSVIDDTAARIGSANMSNRSLGFDIECDLAVQAAGDTKLEQRIAAFRGEYDRRGHPYSNEGLFIGNCHRRITRSIGHRRFRRPSDDHTAGPGSWKLSHPDRVGHCDGDGRLGIAALALKAR